MSRSSAPKVVRWWLAGAILCCAAAALSIGAPGKAEAGTLGCGDTVSVDTTLQADLTNCPNNGLEIGADGVTLDLNGHTIDGDAAITDPCPPDTPCDVGIANDGYDDLVVKDGTVKEFALGVLTFRSARERYARITFRDNEFPGMILAATRGTTIVGSRFVANGMETDDAGIVAFETPRLEFRRNRIGRNGDIGLLIDTVRHASIVGNRITGNIEAGILGHADHSRLVRNRLARNADGIVLDGVDNAIASNRIARSNGCGRGCGMGISLEAGRGNSVSGNTVLGSAKIGVRVTGYGPARNNVVSGNRIDDAGRFGIQVNPVLKAVRKTVIDGNHVTRAGRDGIRVKSSSAEVLRNQADDNGDFGISAKSGVTDGGGNRARGNGEPEQCRNVACS